jgi:hypothetical protein
MKVSPAFEASHYNSLTFGEHLNNPKLNAIFMMKLHTIAINPGHDILPFLSGSPGGIFSPLIH